MLFRHWILLVASSAQLCFRTVNWNSAVLARIKKGSYTKMILYGGYLHIVIVGRRVFVLNFL